MSLPESAHNINDQEEKNRNIFDECTISRSNTITIPSEELNNHTVDKIAPFYCNLNTKRAHQVLCDLNIKIGSNIFKVHKIILASSCDYFGKMFLNNSNIDEITLNEVNPNAFELLLDYMYTSSLIITENNVQDLLIASNYLLIYDIYNECLKFIIGSINVENCLKYKNYAHLNNVAELNEFCLSLILDNYDAIANSDEFLLLSFEQFVELLQVNHSNVKEIKIYEFIMLWVKYDLMNRSKYLSELMTSLNMSKIPLSYFIDKIEREEIIKTNSPDFLYNTLRMYAINQSMGRQMGNNDRKFRKNQLIIIASYTNGEYSLEWMTTEQENLLSNTFSWSTFNSIILSDGRIFCTKHCIENNIWTANMFNGKLHKWNSIGNIEFDNDKGVCSSLVELDECIYMMSPYGYFKRFNMRTKEWQDCERLIDDRPKFRNLLALDGFIYCVSTNYIFRYNPADNTWKVASKKDFSRWYGYATCSLDGCLYLFGGLKIGEFLKMAMKYNPSSNTWHNIADMHIARWNAGAVAVNGLIYVMGGDNCDSLEVYDPESDAWTFSDTKLRSNDHQRTRAFVLDPTTNINSRNISEYYTNSQWQVETVENAEHTCYCFSYQVDSPMTRTN